ncbi:MAG: glycogen debranching protein [Hyphomonadaceae bacterium]|nr:MAG: glycogen debranching protein [Hyphomonadaceae bacterium]
MPIRESKTLCDNLHLSRRELVGMVGASALTGGFLPPTIGAAQSNRDGFEVPADLQREMYAAALNIAKSKIRGGNADSAYKKPFVDAAFSNSIFLWDTCFIATYAKYHQDELPIANALDNFYNLQDSDGYICREYTKVGTPFWPKNHPVSINPPLLAFAELELFGQSKDLVRLMRVYPSLVKFYNFLIANYRLEDGLFFSDALGSGMDNIDRFPIGWRDDGQGIPLINLHPELFNYDTLSSKWNRQGRSVDFSAQMALFADNLLTIARLIGRRQDIHAYRVFFEATKNAINDKCWNEADGFYYDLGYNQQIKRKHIGAFWTLIAGIVPRNRLPRLLAHLTDPNQFWRRFPLATTPADEIGFSPLGDYWHGSVWAPTNYMVIRGLRRYGQNNLAMRLARQYYWCVAQVYNETHTFWENYAPDSLSRGNVSQPNFCGWTGLVPIAIYHEFIRTNHSTSRA